MSCHYRLTIVKLEDNPEWTKARIVFDQYGHTAPMPEQYTEVRQVEVSLSEAEVDCLKQALLKVWK